MASRIEKPTIVKAVGTKDKIIREIFGLVNSQDSHLSIAHMTSPEGWEEPGQCPEFDEFTYVLNGILKVETKDLTFNVEAGQAVQAQKHEWVRYSTPYPGGADYIAVCLPAFSIDTVHRDD
ncbi:MAG: cupin [Acidiferrobacteraceae bacterium]|nr:cupin [Acidiferrobacteraceae bacterium]